ncbi:hypothetical protein [Streptomyces sp. A012304]|uniref:hypothetical protein n=1 Tax=Streptomyces sp. A012304 TaxID=375446 RepID=UPI002232BB07|nr:hypothetical protein [Streptomyces sp. A012304]GKQ34373.1 hypothetical protein ALMP_09230 [Streptomyces sp. A012304]
MLRHEFRPGRLVAGMAFTLAGVIYVGDAGGLWETPWFVVIPVVAVGLSLAGATGVLTRALRRRRGIRRGSGADTAAGSETTA